MAKPIHDLLKKVSSVSAAAAALLSGTDALGSPAMDPETAKRTQEALDALKRATGANTDQVRFHAGGQLDPQAQEILLAGHTSHSSHASGSYLRGDGSSSGYVPSYTPAATPAYAPSYYAPSSAPSTASTYTAPSTAALGPTVNITYQGGTRLAGALIEKGSWGVQLLLKDATRIQIPRRRLRAEDISALGLPESKSTDARDVLPVVHLQLNDGTTYTGRVSAADGEKITMTADDNTSRSFTHEQMAPETFVALQGLNTEAPSPIAPTPSPTPAASPLAAPAAAVTPAAPIAQATPVAIGQQVLIKLKSGSKMLVTLLSRSDDEISFRTKDGHEYRLQASRLSKESLSALGMPIPATNPTPSPTQKGKKRT